MKVAYIAGPYRSETVRGVVENIRRAEAVALWCWQHGWPAICPHLNTRLFDGAADDGVWLQGGLELLRRCDFLVLVEGWEDSEGTLAELRLAEMREMDVFTFEDLQELVDREEDA